MTDVIITQVDPSVVIVTDIQQSVIEAKSQGPQGLSAYQVAVQSGFVGTEQDWLDQLYGNQQDIVLLKSASEIATVTVNFTNRLGSDIIVSVLSILASSPSLIISGITFQDKTVTFTVQGGVSLQGFKIDIQVNTQSSGVISDSIFLLNQ